MKKLGLRIGIDRAIFFTLLSRVWSVVAGLITIIFITHFLSPELQGYYYTFYSLIALQIFAEMGFNFAIIQFASHEMAKLSWTNEGTVTGPLEAKQRLKSLMLFAFYWYAAVIVLMVTIFLPVGEYFFDAASSKGTVELNIKAPWSLLVFFTALNLMITSATSVLEGCGKIAEVAVMRSIQLVFATTSAWIVLSLGGGLYAIATNSLIMALVGSVWLWNKYRRFFKDMLNLRMQLPGINWRNEIWPFQWRIAVSSMSAYFILQLFTPLIYATHGPIMAGQMGMSMQIISSMNGAAIAWITTKAPTFGQLVATNQRKRLDALFFRALIQSFSFLFACVICVLLGLSYLSIIMSPYAERVLPLSLFSFLCLICLARHIVFAEASYLRAHKQEPFMLLSVVVGITTASLSILFIPPLGSAGAVYSYTFTCLLISLIGGSTIFFKKRKEWARKSHSVS